MHILLYLLLFIFFVFDKILELFYHVQYMQVLRSYSIIDLNVMQQQLVTNLYKLLKPNCRLFCVQLVSYIIIYIHLNIKMSFILFIYFHCLFVL